MSGVETLQMFGHPAILIVRIQMDRGVSLDFPLKPESYNLATSKGMQQLLIPLKGEMMEMVQKGILDAEFMGF